MADNFLNTTGLAYYHDRIKQLFADAQDLSDLSDRVDEIIAEGGEPNKIESISVNGTAVTPDANKNVALTIPTKTSDLTNDGDGTDSNSPFATQAYVAANGGAINSISVNGTPQTVTNKNVDLTVPTQTSDLTNDSGFQTSSEVSSAIATALANGNDPYTTESDVDGKIATAVSSAYKYKGSVATVADLPSSGNTAGDVYDVQATGMNYAWDGTQWDALGTYVDTSSFWTSTTGQNNTLVAITTSEIDTIVAGA